MNIQLDQLSWDNFLKFSKQEKKIKKITDFNRLIAHTKNFFLISGYGAFKEGYFLIITKDFIPSYGLVPNDQLEELDFLINITKNIINKNFNKKSVMFEHGMCACVGGLDRAHLHIMAVSKETNKQSLKSAINKTIYTRKAGIKYVKFKKYKMNNIHDINQLMEEYKNTKNIKIVGKLHTIKNLKNLSEFKWPINTINHIKKGGHYVFFKSDFKEASFLTKHNFQTQFGREIVYHNELYLDKNFKKKSSEKKKINPYLDLWRWQHYKFEENILKTIKVAKFALRKMHSNNKEKLSKFKFEII